ncbi:MAG: hypothetical protein J7L25_07420 [Deltaproteobacteria bacterium]|nr:hypothetical protein [Candidatus Tharpella aukensis]
MQIDEIKFKTGDLVKVKYGTEDPDFGNDISGWQGNIFEINDGIIGVNWDSHTLSNFPEKYISQCEEDGLDWEKIYLPRDDIEKSKLHYLANDLEQTINSIRSKHQWDYLGDAGKRIKKILGHIDYEDYFAILETWDKYLNNNLSLPFDAEVSEYQDKGPLQQGNKIRVYELIRSNENYGIIIKLRLNRKVYHFPLCDITVINKKSNNYILIDDYCTWFANR